MPHDKKTKITKKALTSKKRPKDGTKIKVKKMKRGKK